MLVLVCGSLAPQKWQISCSPQGHDNNCNIQKIPSHSRWKAGAGLGRLLETGETTESSSLQSQKYSTWGCSRKEEEGGRDLGRELGWELGREQGPVGPEEGTCVDTWVGTWRGADTSAVFVGRTSWRKSSYSKKQYRYFENPVNANVVIFIRIFLQSLKFYN